MRSGSQLAEEQNPLLSDDPFVWDRLIDAMNPPAILVAIELRMSVQVRAYCTPDDIWQETLLRVWRNRRKFRWQGLAAFRGWILAIATNCVRTAATRMRTQKRGGGRVPISTPTTTEDHSFLGLLKSTTPSQVAIRCEQAARMRDALERLPASLRDVLRLRLFEQMTTERVARTLGITTSAVRHRFRKGAELYAQLLDEPTLTTLHIAADPA